MRWLLMIRWHNKASWLKNLTRPNLLLQTVFPADLLEGLVWLVWVSFLSTNHIDWNMPRSSHSRQKFRRWCSQRQSPWSVILWVSLASDWVSFDIMECSFLTLRRPSTKTCLNGCWERKSEQQDLNKIYWIERNEIFASISFDAYLDCLLSSNLSISSVERHSSHQLLFHFIISWHKIHSKCIIIINRLQPLYLIRYQSI